MAAEEVAEEEAAEEEAAQEERTERRDLRELKDLRRLKVNLQSKANRGKEDQEVALTEVAKEAEVEEVPHAVVLPHSSQDLKRVATPTSPQTISQHSKYKQ